MPVGITKLLAQGKSALAANQTALATTSHNISNVNTEGYSRQRVDLHAEDPQSYGKVQVGSGVKIGAIQRTQTDFISRRIEEEKSSLGRNEGMAGLYQQLESVFKDDADQGISKSVSQFFNDVRTLSTQPESASLRTAVKQSAETVTARFRSVAQGVESVVEDANRRVEGEVAEINSLAKSIAVLNQRIVDTEVTGVTANDQRDARDLALQKLSDKIGVTVTALENGSINVISPRVGVLVNASESYDLRVARVSDGPNPGATRVFLDTGDNQKTLGRDVTDSIESGSLGGYVRVRDREIPAMRAKLDKLAYNLATSVNDVHGKAFARNGTQGNDFFANTGERGAASSLSLSNAVKSDLSNIASATIKNAPGDNRALLQIADLQDARIFDGGRSNFSDFSSGIIGGLGVDARTAYESVDTQKGVVDQLTMLREQTAGVSLDEEAMDMIKFQKAFDASAKMIQVADSMLDTILSLKRF